MEASISFKSKRAYIEEATVITAGWLAFFFAWKHRDLVEEGWRINWLSTPSSARANVRRDVLTQTSIYLINGYESAALQLAVAIRDGPTCCHDHCCHKE